MQEVDMALQKHKWTAYDQPNKTLEKGILTYNYGRSFKSGSIKTKRMGTTRKIDRAH